MMQLSSIPAYAGILLAVLGSTSHAAAPAPLRTELTLSHIAGDKWRADYVFAEAVSAIDLGDQVAAYRQQAWRILTPGVTLVPQGDKETIRSAKPLSRLSVEISAYDAFSHEHYVPISRFGGGGWDFYLGFLYGALNQRGRERPMDVRLRLNGLPGETVVAPHKPGSALAGYAHFGPRGPERMGNVNVIVDPQAPAWVRETIDDTTAKVSQFYEQAFQRKLIGTPLISVAVAGFDGAPGSISIKGGALGGGINYRLQGRGLVDDHPKKRAHVARLVAHEMAHLWQLNLKRGGIGEDQAWIHEGGAEAMMLAAMRGTGIMSEEASEQYAQGLLKECEQLNGDLASYRGRYACGFKRFQEYPLAPIPLWRALMVRSEESGQAYSEPMIRAVLK